MDCKNCNLGPEPCNYCIRDNGPLEKDSPGCDNCRWGYIEDSSKKPCRDCSGGLMWKPIE